MASKEAHFGKREAFITAALGIPFVIGIILWINQLAGEQPVYLPTQSPSAFVEPNYGVTPQAVLDQLPALDQQVMPTEVPAGVLNPFTHVRYPYAEPKPGYKNKQCIEVPRGGTVWGGITVLGEDTSTYSDVGVEGWITIYPLIGGDFWPAFGFSDQENPPSFFINGNQSAPTKNIQPGTIVCGK